jgi:hypothetical protein
MSKLFTSLQVSPEQFLKLQVAAKAYMLDRDYPERRDCIGNRGRGGSDMAKLKLFEYVRSFLEGEGWGERCWGGKLEEGNTQRLRWPQMKNEYVSEHPSSDTEANVRAGLYQLLPRYSVAWCQTRSNASMLS